MAKTIITLGREYCTGGRYIAEDVANALGIKLYDKELITMGAAEEAEFNRLMKKKKTKRKRGFHL